MSRCNITLTLEKRGTPMHGSNGADEVCELIYIVGSAPRCKCVLGQVTNVVSQMVVRIDEYLGMPPRALDRYLNT